jgi:hypothetical protein
LGSTNPITQKPEPPVRCKNLNCTGEFRRKAHQQVKEICFNYCPDLETIMRTVPKDRRQEDGKDKPASGSFQ